MKNYFYSGSKESMTRLCFFLLVLFIIVWETYAVFSHTNVPGLELILTFTAGILINKQYQERKATNGVDSPSVEVPK